MTTVAARADGHAPEPVANSGRQPGACRVCTSTGTVEQQPYRVDDGMELLADHGRNGPGSSGLPRFSGPGPHLKF